MHLGACKHIEKDLERYFSRASILSKGWGLRVWADQPGLWPNLHSCRLYKKNIFK